MRSDLATLGAVVNDVAAYGGGTTALIATTEPGPAAVVHFDEKGEVVFGRRLGDDAGPTLLARDASGAIVIAGTFLRRLDLGVDPLVGEFPPDDPARALYNGFVARLSP